MSTHHTRYGDLEVEQRNDFLYVVHAPELQLNGRSYYLQPTSVQVIKIGWATDVTHSLHRHDGLRRPTNRTREKAQRIVLDVALTAASHAGVTDRMVEAESWRHQLTEMLQALEYGEQRLDQVREQVRIAECHVLAHQLSGAAGEIARALCSDGWPHSSNDLKEAVDSLTSR